MKSHPLLLLLLHGFTNLVSATTTTNYFITPGTMASEVSSGNDTADYPVYYQGDSFNFTWATNFSVVSLVLYQNENNTGIRLWDYVTNPPDHYTYNMDPAINLTWNNVFFISLWNEEYLTDSGPRRFYSSYFRIDKKNTTSSTASAPTTTTASTTSNSTSTETTPSSTSTDTTTTRNNSSGLSSSTKVGLGVGLGLGIPLLAIAAAGLFFLSRGRNHAGDAAWMQQQQQQQQQQLLHQQQQGQQQIVTTSQYSPPVEADSTPYSVIGSTSASASAQMIPQELSAESERHKM
ncbi:hypothetical protein BO71DRAFT_486424 [Aspergillus ellipticus CBS 707.79]|uniref:Mid2 domain-containing protein n=1 Tax=Aspergillus ellipticus CBS 707.79 TaxID=1448320 RepID=A0A319EJX8_9EURO|nr:hypothetical protein BO71DRAFT_486424 [Aspergillus ellipticus CBS 707.79]